MSENKSLVSKSEISSYLHAATEMERDIYTLETMCDELEKKAKEAESQIEYPIKYKIKDQEQKLKQCKECIDNARDNLKLGMKPTNLKTDYSPNEFKYRVGYMESIFGKVFLWVCIGLGVFGLILWAGTDSLGVGLGIVLTGWIPSLIIAAIADANYKNQKANEAARTKNNENARQNAQNKIHNEKIIEKYIESQKEELCKCQNEIYRYQEEIKKLREEAQNYRDQIKLIQNDAHPLYSNRDKFYSVGIVPPDYRTMDCVYVLDQIFRNDLADTMRDAVLLYEERTFRGDVIRGMKNITAHIDNLSSLMSSLRVDINMIGRDVALLRDDMDKIYTQNLNAADAAARHNDRMYEETKLHRYAVEALQKSNQKIVDYIES